MLGELLGIALSSSERRPIGIGVALRIAVVGLLCAVFAVSLVLLFVALGLSFVALVGRVPALALTGASGVLVAAVGLLIARRHSAGRTDPVSVSPPDSSLSASERSSIESLTRRYPLEAVTLAAVAGVFAASTEGASLARPLLDAVLRSLSNPDSDVRHP